MQSLIKFVQVVGRDERLSSRRGDTGEAGWWILDGQVVLWVLGHLGGPHLPSVRLGTPPLVMSD